MASRAIIPSKYAPDTALRFKDRLGEAISAHLDTHRLTPVEVYRRYPSIRAGDIARIRRGESEMFGLNRLIAICEAIGLPVELQIGARS